MRRIKAACLEQVVHFQLKDGVPSDVAQSLLEEEYAEYLRNMERSRIRYKILKEERQPDGSLMLQIIKQYNGHETGEYLGRF